MSATRELLEGLEKAKAATITKLAGDSVQGNNQFYIQDTNEFVEKLINILEKINEQVDIDKFKDLCTLNFEAIYMLMQRYQMLTPDIETLKDFYRRYAHFLNALDAILSAKTEEI